MRMSVKGRACVVLFVLQQKTKPPATATRLQCWHLEHQQAGDKTLVTPVLFRLWEETVLLTGGTLLRQESRIERL